MAVIAALFVKEPSLYSDAEENHVCPRCNDPLVLLSLANVRSREDL